MPELTQKERLQPSLLDRLTDNAPEARQESREQRVMSSARLRESLRRDLAWLFNTIRMDTVQDLEGYPHTAQSVLNYGLPALAGRTASSIEVPDLERQLQQAILTFEPRLIRKTIRVRLASDEKQMDHNALSFYIEAEMWAQPTPLRLLLKTDIDLEAGLVKLSDLGGRVA